MKRMLVALSCLMLFAAPALAKQVLFDEGHAQMFSAERSGELDLSALAQLFRQGGAKVETAQAPLSAGLLRNRDVLVLSGPFAPLTPAEIEAVSEFLERGGRLCVMLHIGPPATSLLNHLGVAVSNGVVREREAVLADNPLDFVVSRFIDHPLTHGLAGFKIYGTWALLPERPEVKTIARTSPLAWVDLDRDKTFSSGDPVQTFDLAVAGIRGQGRFAVFADDAIFQNRFLEGDNETLARNLVAWLLE